MRVSLMRVATCFLVLYLAAEQAFAQSTAPPNTITLPSSSPLALSPPSSGEKSPKRIAEIKARVAFWLKTCLEDWDAQTHMTRNEWRTTCNRVAIERGQFLLTNPDSFSNGEPSAFTSLTESHIATAAHDPKLLLTRRVLLSFQSSNAPERGGCAAAASFFLLA